MPSELNVAVIVSPDLFSHSISSVDPCQLLIRRPYGGVCLSWRNNTSHSCKMVLFDEDRLLGLEISDSSSSILAINVYLP